MTGMLIFAVDWSMEVVELCKKYHKEGVVGIDLAGDESMNCESYPGHKRAYEVTNVKSHNIAKLCTQYFIFKTVRYLTINCRFGNICTIHKLDDPKTSACTISVLRAL